MQLAGTMGEAADIVRGLVPAIHIQAMLSLINAVLVYVPKGSLPPVQPEVLRNSTSKLYPVFAGPKSILDDVSWKESSVVPPTLLERVDRVTLLAKDWEA